jgi:hypothetical protein
LPFTTLIFSSKIKSNISFFVLELPCFHALSGWLKRVLLTRARQGLIIFVPEGDIQDKTRDPKFYDGTYEYLLKCGFSEI